MSTRRFYRRRFLNRRGHHAGAYVIADVSVFRPRDKDAGAVDAGLAISDCSRVVELDFYVTGRHGSANALHKARLLRDVVCSFTEALEAAVEEWETDAKD